MGPEPTTPDVCPVIEVTPNPAGTSMCQLVRDAYAASQERVIVLLLNGVTPEEVDAALDPVVPLYPLNIPGVKYQISNEGPTNSVGDPDWQSQADIVQAH